MASIIANQLGATPRTAGWSTWWPVGLGLLVLYVPTYWMLAGTLWTRDEYLHGPIVLAVALGLFWHQRERLQTNESDPSPSLGTGFLIFGMLLYVIGRSQDIVILEIGSQIPVFAAVLLFACGARAVKAMWFPLSYLAFMVPLPGILIDMLTAPMKQQVSAVAEALLYAAGYPVARSGVVLSVGNYQLLVADACSGLHSLISVSAMGLLYIYLVKNPRWLHNAILVVSLAPIALGANLVRVIVLVLSTFHFGDEAGQGFLHGISGLMLFVVGMLLLFGIDSILGIRLRRSRTR